MTIKRKYISILVLLNCIYSCFLLTLPIISKYIVDVAISISTKGESSVNILINWIVLMVIVVLVEIGIKVLENGLYYRFSVKTEKELKEQFYNEISKKKVSDIESYQIAQIEQLYSTDIQNVIKANLEIIPTSFYQLFRLLLAVGVLIYIDYIFLLVVLVAGIFVFALSKLYSKLVQPRYHKVLESEASANNFILETTTEIKLMKAYDAQETFDKQFKKLNDNQLEQKKKRNLIWFIFGNGIFAFSNLIYAAAIGYGAYMIALGILTYGTLIALTQLLGHIQAPITSLSNILNKLNLAKTSKNRILKLYALEDEIIDEPIIDFDELVLDKVSFAYDQDKVVLDNVTCHIKKGDKVLVCGPSGIGKTTLFMLLLGFIVPDSGDIYVIKDAKKYPISNQTRSLFSYVPQSNVLFSGTIFENLQMLTNKPKEEMIKALKLANIYDEIMKMPDGLDTILKERGSGLSIGQIQRILIAIAILKDRPIFLLDEFSSALDEKNEEIILQNLEKLNKNIIYITHRTKQIDKHKVLDLAK